MKTKGVKTVGYLGAGKDFINSHDREQAIIAGCEETGLECKMVVQSQGWSREEAYKTAKEFVIDDRPEAIFCANDRMAFGLIQKMKEHEVEVPKDLKVIGFDLQDIATLASPKITTIENPFFYIGQKSAEILIAKLNGKKVESISINSRLIVNESA